MKSVYLANFFSKKDQVKQYATELEQLGVKVTARWFDEKVPHTVTLAELPFKYHTETACIDLQDIAEAEVLVLFTGNQADYSAIPAASLARGGRHFEAGFALASGKEVILCGQRENVFHYLPQIVQFDTWEEVKEYLSRS